MAATCPFCGFPIAANDSQKPSVDVEKYLSLALDAIKSKNPDLVEKYCEEVLQSDPENSKAWEYEARGLLFTASLKNNKVPQAINAAANAVKFSSENKPELAVSLYDCICQHVNGLLANAISMPVLAAEMGATYVRQCFGFYLDLLVKIPDLPKEKIEAELQKIGKMDSDSKKAIMPKKRYIWAARVGQPAWDEQFRAALKECGKL